MKASGKRKALANGAIARNMPKYTIPDNFELGHVEGLLRRISESELKSEASEAMLQELVAITNQVTPAGWPFVCGRCRVEGYSLDFHMLAANNCPACGRNGSLELLPMTKADRHENEQLKLMPRTLMVLKVWFESQADRPTEIYDMLVELIRTLKDYGVRF